MSSSVFTLQVFSSILWWDGHRNSLINRPPKNMEKIRPVKTYEKTPIKCSAHCPFHTSYVGPRHFGVFSIMRVH